MSLRHDRAAGKPRHVQTSRPGDNGKVEKADRQPSGFEVVEDIPDGDPCAFNTVFHNHRYTYHFQPLGSSNSRCLSIVVTQAPPSPALTSHRSIPDRTGRRSTQEHHFTLVLEYRFLAIVE